MLQMKPHCEACGAALPLAGEDAFICSYECTFCAACTRDKLACICPNCGGRLVQRPPRRDA